MQGRKQVINMTLSEKIIALRNSRNMSQGDLAEKLNVSRQSVSKWETGASIPDLDKLIAMSNLFKVSLDELAKDDVGLGTRQEEDAVIAKEQTVDKTSSDDMWTRLQERRPQLIVGFLLIFVACVIEILSCVGALPFGRMYGIVVPGYIFMCGMMCIFIKKKAGRKILIITLVLIAAYIFLLWLNTPIKVEIQ